MLQAAKLNRFFLLAVGLGLTPQESDCGAGLWQPWWLPGHFQAYHELSFASSWFILLEAPEDVLSCPLHGRVGRTHDLLFKPRHCQSPWEPLRITVDIRYNLSKLPMRESRPKVKALS